MGIRPEILAAESRRIFQPTLLLITNARIDHREYWGPSRETAARCLAAAIPSDCAVFVPDEETMPVWEEAAARMGSELVRVQSPSPPGTAESGSGPGRSPVDGPGGMLAFEPNARLVKAVTDYMTIDRKTADQGIRRSLPDLGELRIWSWRPDPDGPAWDCVSAFAANDPGSTRMVVEELTELGVIDGKPLLGLLNLRRDRGDRTLQWLEAFRQGDLPGLQELFVTGPHARAFTRRCEGQGSALRPVVLETAGPAALMSALKERAAAPAVVLGMGNMGGAGRDLVEYWEREGERRAV
jgi:hypothetical protein